MLEELRAANARLAERVAALERAAGRNSGNSSMPPSTDDLPGRTKPVGRRVKGSGRSRGKQPGAPGSTLAWVGEPDEQIAHRPQGTCGCGADLADAAEVGIERSHQVHDLPEIRIKVRQHDLYRVRCGCGREHVADRAEAVSAAPASYGPTIRSLIVYLLIYQHVPVARCVELIADLTGGTGPSTGFAHGLLARCATAVRQTVTTIKALITLAHVVGFDETTLRAGPAGAKRHVLSAVTDRLSVFHLGGRDLDSFREFGILPGFAGIAVHDRYQNYFHPNWKRLAGHQVCTAHLLRDYTDAAESYPDAVWPEQAHRALRGLIHASNPGPRRRTGRDRLRGPRPVDRLFPPRRAGRTGRGPPPPRPAPPHRPAPRADLAGVLPRPRTRGAAVHHRHPDLAHQQHQRARPAPVQDPTEDLRAAHQRGHHPGPPRHPQLHRHHAQTRSRCPRRHPRRPHRQPLVSTGAGTGLTNRHPLDPFTGCYRTPLFTTGRCASRPT